MTSSFEDKSYTAICSEKTLQTNENGFFMNFVGLVLKSAGERWVKNVFGKINNDKERIKVIFGSPQVRGSRGRVRHGLGEGRQLQLLMECACQGLKTKYPVESVLSNVQEVYRKKDAEIAKCKKLEGDLFFMNKDFQKALLCYSQSILRAPKPECDPNKTLPSALWARANALIKLEEYALALTDLQMTLKEQVEQDLRGSLYCKMAVCYRALGEGDKANISFALAEKLIIDKKELRELERERNSQCGCIKKELKTVEQKQFVSKKIRVEKRPKMGRFVVAEDHIKTGEPIVVEPPYVACLLPEMFGTHCHHCFNRLVAPVGCPDCSNVAFCSPGCRDTALSTYHRYECKYLDLLIGSGMSILSHTALRMVTQNSLEECLRIYRNRSKEKVYSLCTNAEKRSGEDFLQRTLMAAFLFKCLQKSGYFGENSKAEDGHLTEDDLCVCELLLFHLQILQFNAHEIFETRCSRMHQFKGSKVSYIGVGLYPTVSLFNHDCYPAVTRHFVGKNIVIKTSRPLAPNDMVAENYGPIFSRKPLQQRQRSLLARYWFKCECKACTYNWPQINGGLEGFSKYVRCPNDKCTYYFTLPMINVEPTCPKCKKNVNLKEELERLQWCERQYEIGFEAMNGKRVEEAIGILCEAIDVFHRISRPPHQGTCLAQECLQICEASFGNVWVAPIMEQNSTPTKVDSSRTIDK